MKNLKFYLIAISFLLVFSCGPDDDMMTPSIQEPIASFDISKLTPEVNENIVFSNTSQHATSYSWDFGDGNKSTLKSPSHTYAAIGTFTVSLTATGEGGTNSTSKMIDVMAIPPQADFMMDKSTAEVGETVSFTNLSENATSYEWDFGDGNSSTEAEPTHAFTEVGTYTVKLTVMAEGKTHSTSKSIEIIPPSNPLLGTWNLVSGTFQGTAIADLSGYRTFGDEDVSGGNWTGDSKCSMTQGSDSGYVTGAYEIAGNILKYGYGFTSISWTNNTNNFSRFGVVGLGLQDVEYSITDSVLTITGVNAHGTTVLHYEKQ
ncbi:MAG: PKD domain-containing protein [Saprospiraceae bacterium]